LVAPPGPCPLFFGDGDGDFEGADFIGDAVENADAEEELARGKVELLGVLEGRAGELEGMVARDHGMMTMVEVGMKTMAAGKFKAQCLALLDEVETKRECVTVTKNGRPVAKMVPLELEEDPLKAFYVGGEILGDIMSPAVRIEDYEAMK
jgi:prevent-host-death family protein